jgi:hypothetical protein
MIRIEVTKEQLEALATFTKLWKNAGNWPPVSHYADLDVHDVIICYKAAKALDSARVMQYVYQQEQWQENKEWEQEIW